MINDVQNITSHVHIWSYASCKDQVMIALCQARALRAAFHRAHGFGNDCRLRRREDEGERSQITLFDTLRGALLCSNFVCGAKLQGGVLMLGLSRNPPRRRKQRRNQGERQEKVRSSSLMLHQYAERHLTCQSLFGSRKSLPLTNNFGENTYATD